MCLERAFSGYLAYFFEVGLGGDTKGLKRGKVRKVYMELGSYFLFLQEQIKGIIIYIWSLPPIFCFCKNK